MHDYDYGVIGVGSTGSMALRKIASASSSVLGIEGGMIGHDNSAVGGDTRLFRRVYREGAQFESLLESSLKGWSDLQARSGQRIFTETGMLSIFDDSSRDKDVLLGHAAAAGLRHEYLTPDDINSRFPQFRVGAHQAGIYDPQGGFIRTDVAVRAAVDLATEDGAEVKECSIVAAVESTRSGVVVTLSSGETISFGKVVLTCGARTVPLVAPQLAQHLAPKRVVMTWFGMDAPDDYRIGNFPIFGYRNSDSEQGVYGAPSIDGISVKVSGFIPNGPLELPQFQFDQTVSMEERCWAGAGANKVLQGLSDGPTRATAYADLYSSDHLPIIDWVDDYQRICLCSGFSGKGFKMAVGVGEVVADALLDSVPLDPAFNSVRFCRQ
ncbi:FAD-dependent oxidoreductase [Brevibacterium yomogidense]|uniref:FAD-dependent oxidoreductase n=1 Tax=Brevibacterium yomogidense TaxID=946573 RepID=UPI0018E02817|nr:FAD-dependent oxidoreductase [Brevibacterium yomogidense]